MRFVKIARGKPQIRDAVQDERVRRDFHRARLAPGIDHLAQQALHFRRLGRRVRGVALGLRPAPVRTLTVPSRPHGTPGGVEHRRQQIRRRRLAVRAGHADDGELLARMVVDDRRELGEREPRVRRAKPRHGGAGGARRLGDDRDRAAPDGLRGERRAVVALAAHGDEDRARATRRANRA